jgi:hypothetical protein
MTPFMSWVAAQLAVLDLALDVTLPCPEPGCHRDADLCGWLTSTMYYRCPWHGTVIGPFTTRGTAA